MNANALHLQATFIVNQLLKPTLAAPFYGFGTLGRRSAFLAMQDTPLTVALPFTAETQLRLTRYGADGRRQPVVVSSYQPPLKTRLKQHELLIVEPVAK